MGSRLIAALGILCVAALCPLHATAEVPAATPGPATETQASRDAAQKGASHAIEALHEVLNRVMKESPKLTFDQRSAALTPAVVDAYDFEFMALKILGARAKELSDGEHRRWIEAFQRFTVANYARRFDGYSGQKFETLGEQPAAHDTVLVRSRVVRPGNTDVSIDYRLHRSGEQWKIVDVYALGTVSELAARRAEIDVLLRDQTIAQVIEYLDRKASNGRP